MKQTSEVAMTISENGLGMVVEQGDIVGLFDAIHELASNEGELNDIGVRARKVFMERFDNHIAFESYRKVIYITAGLGE